MRRHIWHRWRRAAGTSRRRGKTIDPDRHNPSPWMLLQHARYEIECVSCSIDDIGLDSWHSRHTLHAFGEQRRPVGLGCQHIACFPDSKRGSPPMRPRMHAVRRPSSASCLSCGEKVQDWNVEVYTICAQAWVTAWACFRLVPGQSQHGFADGCASFAFDFPEMSCILLCKSPRSIACSGREAMPRIRYAECADRRELLSSRFAD